MFRHRGRGTLGSVSVLPSVHVMDIPRKWKCYFSLYMLDSKIVNRFHVMIIIMCAIANPCYGFYMQEQAKCSELKLSRFAWQHANILFSLYFGIAN